MHFRSTDYWVDDTLGDSLRTVITFEYIVLVKK